MADRKPAQLVGLIRVNEHCLFTWRGIPPEDYHGEGQAPRFVDVTAEHCKRCIAEVVENLGFAINGQAQQGPQPDGGSAESRHRATK
jgi:hypothetical protein